jgi:hypothetical protein
MIDMKTSENTAGARVRFSSAKKIPNLIPYLAEEISNTPVSRASIHILAGFSGIDTTDEWQYYGGLNSRVPLYSSIFYVDTGILGEISRPAALIQAEGGVGIGVPLGNRSFAVIPYTAFGAALSYDGENIFCFPEFKTGIDLSFKNFLIGGTALFYKNDWDSPWFSVNNWECRFALTLGFRLKKHGAL